jgi:hypothetical protein
LLICHTRSPGLHMEIGDVDENMPGLRPRKSRYSGLLRAM